MIFCRSLFYSLIHCAIHLCLLTMCTSCDGNYDFNLIEWCFKNQRNRNGLPLKVKAFDKQRKRVQENSTHDATALIEFQNVHGS